MKCSQCSFENPEGFAFCGQCGTKLALVCAPCGFENPEGFQFCGKCGEGLTSQVTRTVSEHPQSFASPESYTPKYLAERILMSKVALEGERKQVTVLFADLKGSMELLADRDPEDARALLDSVLTRMMEAVHRYEGTVNQVMGDGIMALFGAPLALEDHALRACYAALAIQNSMQNYAEEARRKYGLEVETRVGLNSGEVVVRTIGSDLKMDYSAIGQTTHLASRMEQMAPSISIRMTADTLRLAEGFVQVESLGPIPVKGMSEPVEVFELKGATSGRTRFQATAAGGLTRFVGRTSELDDLQDALDRAGDGHGQVFATVAEAGVGKSRLYWEFTRSHRTKDWAVIESSSVSYGNATAYRPVIDLLKAYFDVEDTDDHRRIREKVTGKVLTLDESLTPAIPPILSLLEVPVEDEGWKNLDPLQRRQRTLDGVKRLLLREAQVQPLVLIFEDLHWIDSETQALLDSLVESLPGARVLLLVNYRPEYEHGWANKTYYTRLRLDPLSSEGAEKLLQAILGEDAALEPLKSHLIERTQGNPFYLEESVQTLIEDGSLEGAPGGYRLIEEVSEIEVPSTVQAILASRIDRLPPEDKRLLQTASVIGTHVPYSLLAAIAEISEEELQRSLSALQASEFLYETNLFPEREYTFKHALTREVTYGSLVQERKRTVHAAIVQAIERLAGDRLEEQVERLAHHALRGGLREKAVVYLRQTGHKAATRSALPQALASFEEALAVVATLPGRHSTQEEAFDIRLELRWVLHQLGDIRGALARLREAETCAERLNDDRRRGRACAFMTVTHSQLGELDEALVSGTRALEIAGRLGDVRLRILATNYLENAQYYRGEYERVIELATANLATLPAEEANDDFGLAVPPAVFDRSVLVLSFAQLGRFDEATVYEAEAIRLAEPTHHAYTIAEAHFAASQFHLLRGDWVSARPLVERWIAVIRTGNVGVLLSLAVTISAWILAQLGETSEALNRLRGGEQLLERQAATGIVGRLGWAYCSLGRACLLLGRLDEARCLGDQAVEFSSRQPGFAAHALHLLGDVATHPDRFDAESGEAYYEKALALASELGMRPLIAHCRKGLGALYGWTGREEMGREELTAAMDMYREMGMTFFLKQAEVALNDI